ncbi:MAG TPA: FG-GAP-like repeat-containing protein [Bryobacteraceae bacterium]|nr:FG-GAP-like repeat-containing protein [Bryobacteraceae bacterium]
MIKTLFNKLELFSLIVVFSLAVPGLVRAQLSCSSQLNAFGPYVLFDVGQTGYRFTDIPLDATHHVMVMFSATGGALGVSEVCFASTQTAAVSGKFGSAAQNAAVGDFNGDGLMDVALTAKGNNIAVYLANADHTLRTPVNYAVGFGPSSAVAADFNGDGKLDLAVTNIDSNNVSILLGNGDGTFKTAVNYAAGGGPASIAIGDFNGDGKPDLAITDLGSFGSPAGGVAILLGGGDGTFKSAATVPADASPLAVVSADFNGDGKADLAVANSSGTYISVFLGNGNGTFQGAIKADAGNGPVDLAYGDFGGSGKLDLAVIHRNSDIVSILAGKGDGTFAAPVNYLAGAAPETLSAADVNGDGKLDLLAGGGSNYLAVLIGNGDGTFQAPPAYSADSGPQSVALADFNGDGILDIVTANATADDVSVLLGAGGTKFQPAIQSSVGPAAIPQPPHPVDVVAVDLNADGKPDVAVADQQTNDVAILLGKGDGTFRTPVHYVAGVNPSSLVSGDFNRDGKPDLAVANSDFNSTRGAGNVSILLGNGDGTFKAGVDINAGSHPVDIVAGDFNGDGKLDLAVLNSGATTTGAGTGSVSILLGKGDGTFQAAKDLPAGLNPTALAVSDLNSDGKLDLVVAAQAADLSYVLSAFLGNGDGTFKAATNTPTVFGSHAINIADINLDGRPDLIVAHCCGSTDMTYLLGNGDGTFQPEVHFPGGDSPTAIAVADLNADGMPDAVITAGGSGGVGASSVAIIPNTFAKPALVNVSAASFLPGPVAPESIVSGFGGRLATGTKSAASLPLPTNLDNTTVKVKDAAGTERSAPLFYVSPGQVNYEIPAGTAVGIATITITAGDNTVSAAPLPIVPVAPGIFMLNSGGLVAANVLRVSGTVQSYETVYTVDPATQHILARPIDLGPSTDQVFLLIYGTGIRGRSALSAVTATIGGAAAKVLYAGPQGTFAGLDQVNVLVPRSLAGHGSVDIVLSVNGKIANTSRVTIH